MKHFLRDKFLKRNQDITGESIDGDYYSIHNVWYT